jgi:hypothetical protein
MLVPKLRSLRRPVAAQQEEAGARPGRRIRWRSPRWPRRPGGVLGSAGAEAAGDQGDG